MSIIRTHGPGRFAPIETFECGGRWFLFILHGNLCREVAGLPNCQLTLEQPHRLYLHIEMAL